MSDKAEPLQWEQWGHLSPGSSYMGGALIYMGGAVIPDQPTQPEYHYCDWCSDPKTQLETPDGKPRTWLMNVEEGQVSLHCDRDDGCNGGPGEWFDGYDLLGTPNPIRVRVAVDAPAPHTHWDQIGCDCGVYLNLEPADDDGRTV